MAASAQYTVGSSTPVLLASCPPGPPGPAGWFYVSNGGSNSIYLLGGTNTTAGGPTVAAGSSASGFLFAGDSVYGLATTGSSTPVGVLQTGG